MPMEDFQRRELERHPDCLGCQEDVAFKPSHDGMPSCESGSIASGGDKSHCTCDRCF